MREDAGPVDAGCALPWRDAQTDGGSCGSLRLFVQDAMLTAFSLFLTLYVLARVLWRAPLSLPLRLLLALLTAAGACKLLLFRFFFGSYSPEIPRWFQIGTGIPLGIVLLFAALSLARDGLLLIGWLAERGGLGRVWSRLRRHDARVSLGLAGLAVLLAAIAVPTALRVPAVREVELPVRHLPPELDGLRLAHLTDLHISATFPQAWVRELVTRVNAARPDVILLTGDLMDGSPALRAEDIRPLADLRAPLGVFACPGNHEYYSDYPAWRPLLRDMRIRMLDNSCLTVPRAAGELVLCGVTDPAAARFGLPGPAPEGPLQRLLDARTLSAPDGTETRPDGRKERLPVILLSHRPALFDAVRGKVTLQLSGHTHGGSILGVDLLVAAFNGGYVRGLYGDEDSRLVVSSGCGLWGGFPYRLGVPGEILLLVLRRAGEAAGS